MDLDYNIRKVDIINRVLGTLDSTSRSLIEEWYFKKVLTQEQLERELLISSSKYYRLRNDALRKFEIALGYPKNKKVKKVKK